MPDWCRVLGGLGRQVRAGQPLDLPPFTVPHTRHTCQARQCQRCLRVEAGNGLGGGLPPLQALLGGLPIHQRRAVVGQAGGTRHQALQLPLQKAHPGGVVGASGQAGQLQQLAGGDDVAPVEGGLEGVGVGGGRQRRRSGEAQLLDDCRSCGRGDGAQGAQAPGLGGAPLQCGVVAVGDWGTGAQPAGAQKRGCMNRQRAAGARNVSPVRACDPLDGT